MKVLQDGFERERRALRATAMRDPLTGVANRRAFGERLRYEVARHTRQQHNFAVMRQTEYMVLADYQAYMDCQDQVARAYGDQERWARMSILNVARIGKFSSDRAIREYCEDIWHAAPVTINQVGV